MKNHVRSLFAAGVAVAALLGCAAPASAPDDGAALQRMLKASFRDQGIATVDRLQQDETDAACS